MMKSLWKSATDVFQQAGEILSPADCLHCGEPGLPLCPRCEPAVARISGTICSICGQPLPVGVELDLRCGACKKGFYKFDAARSVFYYREPLSALVRAYKFSRNHHLADYFAERMAGYLDDNESFRAEAADCHVATGVPMHWMRFAKQSYNHAGLLAERVAKPLGLPVSLVMWRKGLAKQQSRMKNAEERRKNIRGAFAMIPGARVKNLRVLLIDDVMTTGSTLSECSRILKEAGAERVVCFTLSRKSRDI